MILVKGKLSHMWWKSRGNYPKTISKVASWGWFIVMPIWCIYVYTPRNVINYHLISDCIVRDCSTSKENSWSFWVTVISLKACVDRKIYPSPLQLGSHWISLAMGRFKWIPISSLILKDEDHNLPAILKIAVHLPVFWNLVFDQTTH